MANDYNDDDEWLGRGPARRALRLAGLATSTRPAVRSLSRPKRRELFALTGSGRKGEVIRIPQRMLGWFSCDRLVADDSGGGRLTTTEIWVSCDRVLPAITTEALGRESTLELLQAVKVAQEAGLIEVAHDLREVIKARPASDVARLDALLEKVPRSAVLPVCPAGIDINFQIEFLADAEWRVWCRGWLAT